MKSDLIDAIAKNAGIAKTDAEIALLTVYEHVFLALERGEDVRLAPSATIRSLVEASK